MSDWKPELTNRPSSGLLVNGEKNTRVRTEGEGDGDKKNSSAIPSQSLSPVRPMLCILFLFLQLLAPFSSEFAPPVPTPTKELEACSQVNCNLLKVNVEALQGTARPHFCTEKMVSL